MHRKATLPPQLERYDGRQRELLEIVYSSGGGTVREIHAELREAPDSIAGIRTLLGRLARRGAVRKRKVGWSKEVTYVPALTNGEIQLLAFRRITELHFGGSRKSAIEALERLAAGEEREDIAA